MLVPKGRFFNGNKLSFLQMLILDRSIYMNIPKMKPNSWTDYISLFLNSLLVICAILFPLMSNSHKLEARLDSIDKKIIQAQARKDYVDRDLEVIKQYLRDHLLDSEAHSRRDVLKR